MSNYKKCIVVASAEWATQSNVTAIEQALGSAMSLSVHGPDESPQSVMKSSFIVEDKSNLSSNMVILVGEIPEASGRMYLNVSSKSQLAERGLELRERDELDLSVLNQEEVKSWIDGNYVPAEEDDEFNVLESLMGGSLYADDSHDEPQAVTVEKSDPDMMDVLLTDEVTPLDAGIVIPDVVPIQIPPAPSPPVTLGDGESYGRLEIVAGPQEGVVIELTPGSFTLGRSPESEIRLNDKSVSRKHAIVTVDQGGIYIKDDGSANGILVNDNRVASVTVTDHTPVAIGDAVINVVFTHRVQPEPEPIPQVNDQIEYDDRTIVQTVSDSDVSGTHTSTKVVGPPPEIPIIADSSMNAEVPMAIPLPNSSGSSDLLMPRPPALDPMSFDSGGPDALPPLPQGGGIPIPKIPSPQSQPQSFEEAIAVPVAPGHQTDPEPIKAPPLPGGAAALFPGSSNEFSGEPAPWERPESVQVNDSTMFTQMSNDQGYDSEIVMNNDIEAQSEANRGRGRDKDYVPGQSFMSDMSPSERAEQSRIEMNRAGFGSIMTPADLRNEGNLTSHCIYMTGSHGGAGKTTASWAMANVLALAFRQLGIDTPVFLIEADYRNPKLAARMNESGMKNLGHAARAISDLERQNSATPENIMQVIEQVTRQQQDTGLNVICCPYNLDGDENELKFAIMTAVRVATSKSVGGVVFVDAGNLTSGNFDQLDSVLGLQMSDRLVVVTENDGSHKIDADRAVDIATRSSGTRLKPKQVFTFLNKSDIEGAKDYSQNSSSMVCGYFPYIPELRSTWIGSASDETMNAITIRAGQSLVSLGFQELRPLFNQQRKSNKGKRKLLRFAGRR